MKTAVAWLVVAGAAFSAAFADDKSALDRFEPTGETVNCIDMSSTQITPVDDQTFLVRVGAGNWYLNRTRGTCRGAASGFTRLELNLFGSNLCSGEIVKIVDQQTGIFRSTCSLGVFEKLRKKEASPDEPAAE